MNNANIYSAPDARTARPIEPSNPTSWKSMRASANVEWSGRNKHNTSGKSFNLLMPFHISFIIFTFEAARGRLDNIAFRSFCDVFLFSFLKRILWKFMAKMVVVYSGISATTVFHSAHRFVLQEHGGKFSLILFFFKLCTLLGQICLAIRLGDERDADHQSRLKRLNRDKPCSYSRLWYLFKTNKSKGNLSSYVNVKCSFEYSKVLRLFPAETQYWVSLLQPCSLHLHLKLRI